MAVRINIFGQRNQLGGGRHFSGFCDAMKSLTMVKSAIHEFDYFSEGDYKFALNTVGADDINIHFININAVPPGQAPLRWPRLPGKNIHWAIFETTTLSTPQLDWLRSADLIFVPSAWGKQVLIQAGFDTENVCVIPEGVDPNKFHPNLRSAYQTDGIFRVLVVGKFEARKGFPELLEGYARAFADDPFCRLVLKSDSPWMKSLGNGIYEANREELKSQVKQAGIENVAFVDGDIDDDDMFHLYNNCDVLLFPSRAEGWGLPLIEAIACGIPVATTYYSGHTEFLAPVRNKVREINHSMVPVSDNGNAGEWAQATDEDIAASLLEMRQNINTYRARALDASATIRRNYSWQRAAEIGISALQDRFGIFHLSVDI